ncbi:MAG TPA: BON domain-containing protein [Burkholderiaceae bacterium]
MQSRTDKSFPFQLNGRSVAVASAIAMALALGACSKQQDDPTVGQQIDSAVTKTEQAAADAKAQAKESIASTETSVKDAAQDAKVATQNTANTVGASVEDATITASVNAALVKDKDLSAIKIDVDTKNGKVTLYGPAPNASARERATTIAKAVKGVTAVDNQLVIQSS